MTAEFPTIRAVAVYKTRRSWIRPPFGKISVRVADSAAKQSVNSRDALFHIVPVAMSSCKHGLGIFHHVGIGKVGLGQCQDILTGFRNRVEFSPNPAMDFPYLIRVHHMNLDDDD